MCPAPKPLPRSHGQYGSILLEGLITIVVVSMGVLALAVLQAQALNLNGASLLRSKATFLANEMADRARANLPAVVAGGYNALSGTPANPGCVSTGCTTAQLAQNDYFEWTSSLAAQLPGGTGIVCLTSTPTTGTPAAPACDGAGNVLAIKIWWAEKSGQTLFYTTFRP